MLNGPNLPERRDFLETCAKMVPWLALPLATTGCEGLRRVADLELNNILVVNSIDDGLRSDLNGALSIFKEYNVKIYMDSSFIWEIRKNAQRLAKAAIVISEGLTKVNKELFPTINTNHPSEEEEVRIALTNYALIGGRFHPAYLEISIDLPGNPEEQAGGPLLGVTLHEIFHSAFLYAVNSTDFNNLRTELNSITKSFNGAYDGILGCFVGTQLNSAVFMSMNAARGPEEESVEIATLLTMGKHFDLAKVGNPIIDLATLRRQQAIREKCRAVGKFLTNHYFLSAKGNRQLRASLEALGLDP